MAGTFGGSRTFGPGRPEGRAGYHGGPSPRRHHGHPQQVQPALAQGTLQRPLREEGAGLGAAPGGWSQLARKQLGDRGRVVALDILDMPPIAGVDFLHGDFREPETLSQLEALLAGAPVDLVLSDMAPNMSGVAVTDQARAMHLSELALDLFDGHQKRGGAFHNKLFMGVGFDDCVRQLRTRFERVVIRKPEASRKRSTEVYALATAKREGPMK